MPEPGQFYAVGKIAPSNTGRSYKVYILDDSGKWVFLGLVTKRALAFLIDNRIRQADICKFSEPQVTKEPTSFGVELKP